MTRWRCSPSDRATDDAPPVSDYAARARARAWSATGERIDELLAEHAEGWTLDRMPAVDRAMLRIAVYELLWVDEIDRPGGDTEAVEPPARCPPTTRPRFVNGVLGRIADIADHLRATR